MRIEHIIKTFSLLSDDALKDKITEIRKRRIEAPVAVETREKKKLKTDKEELLKLLQGVSKSDILKLLK